MKSEDHCRRIARKEHLYSVKNHRKNFNIFFSVIGRMIIDLMNK